MPLKFIRIDVGTVAAGATATASFTTTEDIVIKHIFIRKVEGYDAIEADVKIKIANVYKTEEWVNAYTFEVLTYATKTLDWELKDGQTISFTVKNVSTADINVYIDMVVEAPS